MPRKKTQHIQEIDTTKLQSSEKEFVSLVLAASEMYANTDFEGSYKAVEAAFNAVSADFTAEDRDWAALGSANGMEANERRHAIVLSRKYARHDGNCRQILRLWTDFAIGRGFTWRAENPQHQKIITNYWERRENRKILSASGQKTMGRRLLVDGEIYFAHFPARGGNMTTRTLDPLEMVDKIVNPEDKNEVIGYKREFSKPDAGVPETKYYLDWLQWGVPNPAGVLKTDGKRPQGLKWEKGVFVHNIVHEEDENGSGVPLLLSTIVYAKAYRHFVRARAAIQQAVAMFARKIKAKGSQETLNRILNQTGITQASSEAMHSQSPGPGSTWAENEGMDMQPLKMDTGAADAQTDASLYLQNIGVGAGVFGHWLGSGESYRLSTAEKMEAPMQKAFESFQQTWIDEYRYVFEFLITISDGRRKSAGEFNLDVEAPLIATVDVPRTIHALNEMMNVCPAYKKLPDIHKTIWTHLGAKDTEVIWARLLPLLEEMEEKEDEMEQNKLDMEREKMTAMAAGKNLNGDGGSTGSSTPTAGQQTETPPADKKRRPKQRDK